MPSNRVGYWKEWYHKNKEKRLAYQKERWPIDKPRARVNMKLWRKDNKEKIKTYGRAYRLRTSYGLTPQEYDTKLYNQNGLCAICNCPGFPLTVDHNHKTGVVRGLLCNHCNMALGQVREDCTILKAAIIYLEKHESHGNHKITKPQSISFSGR